MQITVSSADSPKAISKNNMVYGVIYEDTDDDYVVRLEKPPIYSGDGDLLLCFSGDRLRLFDFTRNACASVVEVPPETKITLSN